jgi:hypothetical protein
VLVRWWGFEVRDLYIEAKKLETLEKENIVSLIMVSLATMSAIDFLKNFRRLGDLGLSYSCYIPLTQRTLDDWEFLRWWVAVAWKDHCAGNLGV